MGFQMVFYFSFVAPSHDLSYNSRFTFIGVATWRNAETAVSVVGSYGRDSGIFSTLPEGRQDVGVVHALMGGVRSAFCLPAFRLDTLNHGNFSLLDAGRRHYRDQR